ncbi:MAG: hypothetical protein AAFN27_19420 [Pseudomonadota bacterium]
MSTRREVLLGWRNSSPQAALAFYPPQPIGESDAAGLLPPDAGGDSFADRTFVLRCPWNLRMKPGRNAQGEVSFQRANQRGALSAQAFAGLGEPFPPTSWRVRDNPVFQLSLNLFLISDEPCSVQLMPPFLSPRFRAWPGSLICGRFPITDWPRPLNAALEWQGSDAEWVLKRGEPIAYAQMIYQDPDAVPKLIEARMTRALKRHTRKIDNVAQFARNVGPMFENAAEARPQRLMVPKDLADP